MAQKKHIQVLAVLGAILSLPLKSTEVTGDPSVDFESTYLQSLKAGRAVKVTANGVELATDDTEAIGIINSSALQNVGGMQYNIASASIDVVSGGSYLLMELPEGETPAVGAKVYVKDGIITSVANAGAVGVVTEVHADGLFTILINKI